MFSARRYLSTQGLHTLLSSVDRLSTVHIATRATDHAPPKATRGICTGPLLTPVLSLALRVAVCIIPLLPTALLFEVGLVFVRGGGQLIVPEVELMKRGEAPERLETAR